VSISIQLGPRIGSQKDWTPITPKTGSIFHAETQLRPVVRSASRSQRRAGRFTILGRALHHPELPLSSEPSRQ
jgi:hypothetical protein